MGNAVKVGFAFLALAILIGLVSTVEVPRVDTRAGPTATTYKTP